MESRKRMWQGVLLVAGAALALAGPAPAQELHEPGVSPGRASANSIFNHSVKWTWDLVHNNFPWYPHVYTLGPEEVTLVDPTHMDIKIPQMLGVDRFYEVRSVGGQAFPALIPGGDQEEDTPGARVNLGNRVGGNRVRVTLPAPVTGSVSRNAVVRVGGIRVVEAEIPVDPEGDGMTFYTRAAPIVGVTGVFDENGQDYWEVHDSQGRPTGQTGTIFNPLRGTIRLAQPLPSFVRTVKIIYWTGPIRLGHIGGGFTDDDGNFVPLAAGWDRDKQPYETSNFVISTSKGLNLQNNPRAVPGVNLAMGTLDYQEWTTRYIKRDENNAPVYITELTDDDALLTGAQIGDLDTEYRPGEPPLQGADPSATTAIFWPEFNDPYVTEAVLPVSSTVVQVTPPDGASVTGVRGVWLDSDEDNDGIADLDGPNYFVGSNSRFDPATGILDLGTALPPDAGRVWVQYTYAGMGNSKGGGGDIDDGVPESLLAAPSYRFVNRFPNYDPLIAEQHQRDLYWRINPVTGQLVVDANARKLFRITDDFTYTDDDQRYFRPLNDQRPDEGNSSTAFSFRNRFYSPGNVGPQGWLPNEFALTALEPGPRGGNVLFLKTQDAAEFNVYDLEKENPQATNFALSQSGYPGDYGVGYLLRMEPNAGYARVVETADTYAAHPVGPPNNYISLPLGRHSYFMATSDDRILAGDGLWPNPLVPVGDFNEERSNQRPWWTQQNPPPYHVGTPEYALPMSQNNNYSAYEYADITRLVPGPETTGYQYDSGRYPVVWAVLSGIPFGQEAFGHVGGGYFLGTISPYTSGADPQWQPVTIGQSAGIATRPAGRNTCFGKSNTRFTFRIIFQGMNPDTGVGCPPIYIKVFINNRSTAKPTLPDGSIDPEARYVGYTMAPVKPNPTEEDYRLGLMYEFSTTLPLGPHSYYFEAMPSCGVGPIRFPVRPDGRLIDAPPAEGDDTAGKQFIYDPYVPGEEDFADNNDYMPGPYVNYPPVLANGQVSPGSGPFGTEFTYTIRYSDPDNHRPYQADLLIEVSPGNVVRVPMQKVDPNDRNYVDGVDYYFKTSSLQGSVLAPGVRRFRMEFADDWGGVNSQVEGERVYFPATQGGVVQWVDRPTVTQIARPLLSDGVVTSSDGTSNPSTLWTYQVKYAHGSNTPPSYVSVYIGQQRHADDPDNVRSLVRMKPASATSVRLPKERSTLIGSQVVPGVPVPVLNVTGVWQNASGTGTNHFTGGSFDSNTGVLTLGTPVDPGRDVWVTYSTNPIIWDGGHAMAPRDPTDTLYSDGAVYQFQTTLPGPQNINDLPVTYYYSFQASDGTLAARFADNSPSSFALIRQPSGEGSDDTGEILDHASSIGRRIYTAQHFPLVGPLPQEAGALIEPIIYRNGVELMREYVWVLDSDDLEAESPVTINPNGFQIVVDPAVVHQVRGVWTTTGLTGTNYYATGAGGTYDTTTGVISLGTQLPAGVRRVFVEYYNRGDYRLDFTNGKIIFTEANEPEDELEMEYWWAAKGPAAVGFNNPPSLSNGSFSPNNATGVDGSNSTQFTFTVTYRDTDGQTGQAPTFVNVVIDGVPHAMQSTGGTNPVYANGVVYTYTTALSGGEHLYYFEASDGTGYALFDATGPKNSTTPITGDAIQPIPGPVVNNDPVLAGGNVSPNPAGGIAPGTSVQYVVTYTDPDGDAPNIGYPKVWIDNPTSTDYSGKISDIDGARLTIAGANWQSGALAGKLLQVTTGLVLDPDTGVLNTVGAASGKIFQIVDNGPNTVTIAAADAAAEGIQVGDTISATALVMSKQDPQQNNFRLPVTYVITVPSMPIGTHTYHFTASSPPTNTIVRDPGTGERSGPTVRNTPPTGNAAPVLSNASLTGGSIEANKGLASDTFTFRVSYRDPDGDPAGAHDGVFGFVKLVFENNSYPAQIMQPVTPPTDWTQPVVHEITLTGLPAGTHRYHFEASDGYRAGTTLTRLPVQAVDDPVVIINSRPVLSLGAAQGVSPANGTPDTTFTWSVTYSDADGDAGQVFVVIDGGDPIAMTKNASDNDYAAGVRFSYSQKLGLGSHNFRFTANDGFQNAESTPLQSGPIVQLLVGPELKDPNVQQAGSAATTYVYSVKYRDPNGASPTRIVVIVDNSQTAISLLLDSVDGDGWSLYKSPPVTLSSGQHTYHFEASNGQVTTRLPAAGELQGPTVSGAVLTLSVAPTSPNLGDPLIATGTLSPASLNPATITVTGSRAADGTVVTRTVNTDSAGNYTANLGAADVSGQWTITASWAGGGGFPAQTQSQVVSVGGFAINLVAGRVDMLGLTLIPTNPDPALIFGNGGTPDNTADDAATMMRLARWSPLPPEPKYLMYPTDRLSMQLTGGSGFWVMATETATVYAEGKLWPQNTPYSILLNAGWNQIGSVFVNPISLRNAQVRYQGQTRSLTDAAANNWIRDYAWGWNPAAGARGDYYLVRPGTSTENLDPGRGYWIRALVDCELILRP